MTTNSRSNRAALIAAVLALTLAACSTPVKLDEPASVESRDALGSMPARPAGASVTPQSQVTAVELERRRAEEEAARNAATLGRTVYFDFDSYVVRDDFRPLVESYAKVLTTLKSKHMVLEGHGDERGGREYNLALGQKRAEAVARALELLGVDSKQLEAVSFGEERPADPGHDEAAWAKNRRVELKDR